MKKTKTLAKRILSVALATMIVLSFALISVSALPADLTQVGTNGELITFDTSAGHITKSDCATFELSSEQFRGESGKSLKISGTSTGYARVWYSNGVKFEPNSTYYVSYWYYTNVTWLHNFGGMDSAGGITLGTKYTSGSTANQWNKVWFTITTGDTVSGQWFRPSFWSIGEGTAVYVDDFEIRQIESAEGLKNTIPEGTTAEKMALAYGENLLISADQLANGTNSGDTVEKTIEYAHWSEQSYKFVAKTASATGDTGMYVNIKDSKFFGSGAALKANTPYYISYYVYCPTKSVSTMFNYFQVGGTIINQSIPQNQWTKITAVFVPTEEIANAANSNLLRLWLRDTKDSEGVNHPVYLDDLVIAELTEAPAAAVLTAENVNYDFANNTAVVTIASTQELKSKGTITAPDGVTVDKSVLSADGKSIAVTLSGLALETDYALTVAGAKDVFGRSVEEATVAFKTPTAAEGPMSFTSTSIADGYAAVYAPVDAIYFTVPYALDPATVVAENFAIEGYNATVTDVELLGEKDVKVSVSGIYPYESYVFSVDNVKNTSGGILKDTLSFSTTTAGGQSTTKFNDPNTLSSYLTLTSGECSGYEYVTDFGHGDSTSVKLKTVFESNTWFSKVGIRNMLPETTYLISFWYYSDYWNGNTTATGGGRGTVNSITIPDKTKGQWNRVTVNFTTNPNIGGMNMVFWAVGAEEGTVYIDDLKVIELYTHIGSPVVKSNGAYRNAVVAGTTNITIPVNGDATAYTAYAAQYDADGKMLRAAIGTSTENAINITLENGEEAKTKVFIWNTETGAPIDLPFKYNYNYN